jgi:hypothetical protein
MVPIVEEAPSLVMHRTTLALLGALSSLFTATTLMAQGTCPSNVPAGVTKCYFIDYASGSDANNGTTESAPWQHAPGFANATGAAAAHTPVAGEGWIFKGGVTVDYHAWPAFVPYGGTGSNPTYIGVDPVWFTGGSWTRPIFSGGGSKGYDANARSFLTDVAHNTNYFIIDSIEFTGLYWSSNCGPNTQNACGYLATHSFNGSRNWEAKNLYVHGWSHGTTFYDPGNYQYLIGVGMQAATGTQSSVHDSIFDGSDTTKDCCGAGDAAITYNNYYAYLDNMFFQQAPNGQVSVFHDNYIVHQTGTGGNNSVHSNCFHSFAAGLTTTGGTFLVYNNYIDCKDAGTQAEGILFEVNGVTVYIFNNVVTFGNPYGVSASLGNTGGNTYYVFNNTLQPYGDAVVTTPTATCYTISGNSIGTFADNFCLTNNNDSLSYLAYSGFSGSASFPSPKFSVNCGTGRGAQTNLGMSQICAPIGSGNGTGNINITETYPFAPMDSTAVAKVGTGQNNTAFCTAISAINAAAGTACLSDTSLGVCYDPALHTVTWPYRTPVARPTGTANWTNGAYESGIGTTASLYPPRCLTAKVN